MKNNDVYRLTLRRTEDGLFAEVPPQAAECIGPRPVVSIAPGRRLRLFSAEDWAELVSRFEALAPIEKSRVRTLFSTADETELDGGVICINNALAAYVGIKEEAMLTYEDTDPSFFGTGWFLSPADGK